MIMRPHKIGARAEYRQQEGQRIKDSASLADKFPQLKSLTVDLTYFNPGGVSRNSQIKYTVNLANAKSRFRFSCPNEQCVGGDFDLSAALAKAVTGRRKLAVGELRCQGYRKKANLDKVPCQILLRYKLSLLYV